MNLYIQSLLDQKESLELALSRMDEDIGESALSDKDYSHMSSERDELINEIISLENQIEKAIKEHNESEDYE